MQQRINAWIRVSKTLEVGKLRLRIANKSVLSPTLEGWLGDREKERKKIISTGSLLADPISGSTVDGRRCLRVDRIATSTVIIRNDDGIRERRACSLWIFEPVPFSVNNPYPRLERKGRRVGAARTKTKFTILRAYLLFRYGVWRVLHRDEVLCFIAREDTLENNLE